MFAMFHDCVAFRYISTCKQNANTLKRNRILKMWRVYSVDLGCNMAIHDNIDLLISR
jgi:hypothetical protein